MENTNKSFDFKEGVITGITKNTDWLELNNGENIYLLEWINENSEISDAENERLVNNAYEEQKALWDI